MGSVGSVAFPRCGTGAGFRGWDGAKTVGTGHSDFQIALSLGGVATSYAQRIDYYIGPSASRPAGGRAAISYDLVQDLVYQQEQRRLVWRGVPVAGLRYLYYIQLHCIYLTARLLACMRLAAGWVRTADERN